MLLLSVVQELGLLSRGTVTTLDMLRGMFTFLQSYAIAWAQEGITGYVKYVYSSLRYTFGIDFGYSTGTVFIGAGWRREVLICGAILGVLWWRTSVWYSIKRTTTDTPRQPPPRT